MPSSLLKSSFQPIRGSLPTVQMDRYLTLLGIEYEVSWIEPVVVAGTKVYLTNLTHPTKYTLFNTRTLLMDQERGFYRAYTVWNNDETPVGDPNIIFNLRADTTIFSGGVSQRVTGPTGIIASSKTADIPLFGSAGQGTGKPISGDLQQESAIRVIPPNTKFLVEFENASANDCYFQVLFKWYEISPESLPTIRDL